MNEANLSPLFTMLPFTLSDLTNHNCSLYIFVDEQLA